MPSFSTGSGPNGSGCIWSAMKSFPWHEGTTRRPGRPPCRLVIRRWQYTVVHQIGGHIILETSEPFHQRIVVPKHDPLRIGTFVSILRSVARHIGSLTRRDCRHAVEVPAKFR
jgi:predicted RNA binding protein YcfA (HicA-like mRNA interferase family)